MGTFKGARTQRESALRDQPLLTKADIQKRYHVSPATVTRLIERGVLTPVRIGTIDRISEADWLRYLSSGRT